MSFYPSALLAAVQSVLPRDRPFIPLHEPRFAGNERRYVDECIETGWVSSVGAFVDRFERDLAAFTGAKRAIVVVNGTAALHLALQLAGVEAGDEVLIPALTFVATANAVAYCGATPHLCDVEEGTLGLDAAKLERHLNDVAYLYDGEVRNLDTGARIAAVVPMHAFGHPVNLDALVPLCEKWHLPMIEDAAESLGSYWRGHHTGTFGRIGTLSFNGNKIITTGGGGALLFHDEALADRAKHLSTTAKVPHRWEFCHDEIGYNYRMPNLNAALGCAQLEMLPQFLESKRRLAVRYAEALADVEGARFVREPDGAQSNYWLNALLLDREQAPHRDEVLALFNESGVMARPAWQPMHHLPMYQDCPRMDVSGAEDLEQRLINVPSSAEL